MSVNAKSLANLQKGDRSKGDRKATYLKLTEEQRGALRMLGGGDMTAGAAKVGALIDLIVDCRQYVTVEVLKRIDELLMNF